MAALFALADIYLWLPTSWAWNVGQTEDIRTTWQGRSIHFHWLMNETDLVRFRRESKWPGCGGPWHAGHVRSVPPRGYQSSNGSVDSKSVLLLDDTTITVVAVLSVETLEHVGGMEVSGDG